MAQERLKLPLSITTKEAPAEETLGRRCRPVGITKVPEREVLRRYKLGGIVMESTNAGIDVIQAIRLSDRLPVVIKTRQRPGSFKTPQLEREWRRTTEVQLGMPKTDRLCQYFEVLETDSCYYVVMEKIEGKDLFEVMADTKPDFEDAREIVRQVLEALALLHQHGRIHKDLKIENVMVDVGALSPPRRRDSGSPPSVCKFPSENAMSPMPSVAKLIDFDTVSDWEPSSPKAKEVLGTDGYIAPEAYLGQYSPASDLYAAGVVMYKTLTGEFPTREEIFDDKPGENWVGSPSMKKIYARLQDEAVDFTRPPFDKDHAAADLCSKLLKFEADDRPTAEDALQHDWFLIEET